MEEELKTYIETNYEVGAIILGKEIREKARQMTAKVGFKSSKGWLKNFVRRYKLE